MRLRSEIDLILCWSGHRERMYMNQLQKKDGKRNVAKGKKVYRPTAGYKTPLISNPAKYFP